MSRVAIATSDTLNRDPDAPLLLAALAELHVAGAEVVWDDPSIRWDDFDLVVVRSTWDYSSRRGAFLRWAAGVPRLLNTHDVLEYSSDKHYLGHLAEHGVATIPTRYCDVGSTPDFFAGEVVVKPCVGAGSYGAARFAPEDRASALAHVAALHEENRDVLVQPYVESVDVRGERGLVFIDGTFSHAMTKATMLNVPEAARDFTFRRRQMSLAVAEPEALAAGRRALAAAGFADLLYARVDLVWHDAEWQVMELELVEPSLFLSHEPAAALALARAIATRVA